MSIITTAGRSAIAHSLKNSELHLAWGTGLPAWDTESERENRNAIELVNEVGRRKVLTANFCRPDEAGEIILRGARFTQSQIPTPNLHLRCEFDFDDGLGQTIRELGVFIGTQTKNTVPAGKRYLEPQDLENKGILLTLDHITAIERGVGSRISFDIVITF